MSDRKTPARLAKVLLEPGAVNPAATAPMNPAKIRGRHAAIINDFDNWRNYKEWAEKMRGTWGEKK
jgi:hypothetical protein